VLNSESIDKLRSSAYFTSNSHLYNESEFEELKEMNPREAKDENKYQKYVVGQKFVAEVIAILEKNKSDKVYMDYSEFEKHLKTLIGKVEGFSESRLTGIAMVLSEIDKTAVVQKDRKGNNIIDTTTKDTETIKLTQDVEEYFKAEVYPHVPDAMWFYEFDEEKKESATNKEKKGAEFPFTRFFYEYKAPEKADDLLKDFMELEKSLTAKIAELQ
jgi:type I restriction enzyme M protein